MTPYGRYFLDRLGRSIDGARQNLASTFRLPSMDAPEPIHLWTLSKMREPTRFALGCDRDIGGLSAVRLDIAEGGGGKVKGEPAGQQPNTHGRFWGTLSNHVPRAAKIDRSGYAGMRSSDRSTLFGLQTWDTSLHHYIALRVRNPLALSESTSGDSSYSLASVLSSPLTRYSNLDHLSTPEKACLALGNNLKEPVGPKYYVNIQTDGPVTTDLFSHRLWFDPAARDQWQTVVIPLNRFVLLNIGDVCEGQITMMRSAIRTIGISCLLEAPALPGWSARELRAAQQQLLQQWEQQQQQQKIQQRQQYQPQEQQKEVQQQRQQEQQQQRAQPWPDAVTEAPSALRRGGVAPRVGTRPVTPRTSIEQRQHENSSRDVQLREAVEPEQAGAATTRGIKRGEAQHFRFELRIQSIYAVSDLDEARELWSSETDDD